MSQRAPEREAAHALSPVQSIGLADTDSPPRLKLPEPKPNGTNPFEVLSWILFTYYVAAHYLTTARQRRVEQLGRKMRTEIVNGVRKPHWEDDVAWRDVDAEVSCLTLERWWAAHKEARHLCAALRIPFEEYNPILKAAWDKLNAFDGVIRGIASEKEVHQFGDLESRLWELAQSTTLAALPAGSRSPDVHTARAASQAEAGENSIALKKLGDPKSPTPAVLNSPKGASPQPEPSKKKGKNVYSLLAEFVAKNPDAIHWTTRQLARAIGCSHTSVQKCDYYQNQIMSARRLHVADSVHTTGKLPAKKSRRKN